jgi:hypothetical protein
MPTAPAAGTQSTTTTSTDGVVRIAVDSRGILYTGATYEGKRLQKFRFTGIR